MKRIAVILFSLVLAYGGVAWALGKCLSHDRHHQHAPEGPHFGDATSLNDFRDAAWPIIHCPPAQMRIGPAAQSGSTKLRSTHGFMSVQAPFFHMPGSATPRDSLWLEAVFRPILTSFYPDNLGRHLVLSVLRI
jgi:hypothetical protein